MSLTSILAIPEVRQRFREEFDRPRRPAPKEKRVERQVPGAQARQLGVAFDYLLRFTLEHRYPDLVTTKPWVAENGLDRIKPVLKTRSAGADRRAAEHWLGVMQQAKRDHAAYLKTGEVTDGLLESVWRLADLDGFYRAFTDPTDVLARAETPLGEAANELRALLSAVPFDEGFQPRNLLTLNPTFGEASTLVGGADADIILDDTVIDIKTTVEPKVARDGFNQLIGYAALAELGGINGGAPHRMQRLSVYHSRYGTFESYAREEVIDEDRWPLFLEWFVERAMEENPIASNLAPAFQVPVLPSRISGSFDIAANYRTGNHPVSVAVGDFNGDGNPDLVVANCVSRGTVSVLLANGDGTFQAPRTYEAGANPRSVAVGDFNGDGNPDLVVANKRGVSVLRGNGDGTFQAPRTYEAGANPRSVAVGDFNGDGNLDLAVANGGSGVSVLLGNGDGSFQPAKTYRAGNNPWSVAVGDLDGDGVLDLAVANNNVEKVSVLLGNGDGTFQRLKAYKSGAFPVSVAVGDFYGDGNLDLAVANEGRASISVLLGNGDGTFRPRKAYAVGATPVSVAVGDLNGDGVLDLAVANKGDNTVSVLLGNGDGTFQRQMTCKVGTAPVSVAVGDFDGDGKLDLAVANDLSRTVSLLLGNRQ